MGYSQAQRAAVREQFALLADIPGGVAYYSCLVCYTTIEAHSSVWAKPNLITEHLAGHLDYSHGIKVDDLLTWKAIAHEDLGGETAR